METDTNSQQNFPSRQVEPTSKNTNSNKRSFYQSMFRIMFVVLLVFIAFWTGWLAQQQLTQEEDAILNDSPKATEDNQIMSNTDNSTYVELKSIIDWYGEPIDKKFNWNDENGHGSEIFGWEWIAFNTSDMNPNVNITSSIQEYLLANDWVADDNNSAGGGIIVKAYSKEDQKILIQHNLTTEAPSDVDSIGNPVIVNFE